MALALDMGAARLGYSSPQTTWLFSAVGWVPLAGFGGEQRGEYFQLEVV